MFREEPENPDPYNDNASSRITNQNGQNTALNSNNDSFFDDDFEEVIDLEEVTVIERRKEETESVQENTCSHGQVTRKETNEITEDTLEDIDFEPLENWPSEPSMISSRVLLSRTETEKNDKRDIMIIEEASTSTRNFHDKQPLSTSSIKNQNFSEFPDDDFDFDDCNVIIKTNELQRFLASMHFYIIFYIHYRSKV